MGNELSHSNTDQAFLTRLSDVYRAACEGGMACSLRSGGAPSMYSPAARAEIDAPAPAVTGPGLELG